jgi:hypothetical protein
MQNNENEHSEDGGMFSYFCRQFGAHYCYKCGEELFYVMELISVNLARMNAMTFMECTEINVFCLVNLIGRNYEIEDIMPLLDSLL